ncbi:MAG TPA: gamma-glutamylcyclotransferase [Aliidongia sp.]|nr:gamma-glutamylcyclotransferase [Aliidongia sp.]
MSRRIGAPDRSLRLSRELLEAGGLEAILAGEAPGLRMLTDEERRESLRAVLEARPPGESWLFAYGSLIWNPTIHCIERRIARIKGWHRAFCLSAIAGRGSPERPGLVLALDEGGVCDGIALRIVEGDIEDELALLWRREMVAAAYLPCWVDVLDREGRRFGSALAFTIDQAGRHYAGDLDPDTLVHRLATAAGSLGSSADYLFRTRDELRAYGIPDPALEELAAQVAAAVEKMTAG